MTTIIESGIQLLARITDSSKKPLQGLEERLFPDGLGSKQTVEISGDPKSGKTLLLTQLIASCILPTECNGFGINVLLINTDNHFSTKMLNRIMKNYVKISFTDKSRESLNDKKLKAIIESSLKNLLIINSKNYYQFTCNLYSLSSILSSNSKIGIVALDSISAFYWQDRDTTELSHLSLNSYVLNTLKTVQQSTFQYSVKLIFTRQNDLEFKSRSLSQNASNCESILGEVNHRINLSKDMYSTQGVCKVNSAKGTRSINYETCDVGIKWLNDAE